MAAGDVYVDCVNKEISTEQLLRSIIYDDGTGKPIVHTDPSGTILTPWFSCDRQESLEQAFRNCILEDADGKPYLNTTS